MYLGTWYKTWKGKFTVLTMLMVYGAFNSKYYLWVRQIFTNKKGTIIDE